MRKFSRPLLTIAIPTYNRAEFLEKCLSRVLAQCDFSRVEVLVSDNCSEPSTQKVVNNFQITYPELAYYRNDENIGMDGNFLCCYERAKGDYLWLLGDDDFLLPGVIKELLKILEEQRPGVLHLDQRTGQPECLLFDTLGDFVRHVGYWLTYCSANIFRIDTQDVDRSFFNATNGSLLSVTHMFIHSAANYSASNIVLGAPIISGGHDLRRNGGYNFFKVFGDNLVLILRNLHNTHVLSWRQFNAIKFELFRCHIYPNYKRYVLNGEKSLYDVKGVHYIIWKNFLLDVGFIASCSKYLIAKWLSR